jgi:hypothetical protein
MKRVIIVLAVLLLFSIPNIALAEQAQELYTLWTIPWKCTADEFLKLAYENTHVKFDLKVFDESNSSITSKADGIPFFDFDVENVYADFSSNEFAFAFIHFPEQTAAFYDIKQLKDTIEKCVQDLQDKWSALTKEYGRFTNADFCLTTEELPVPLYKVPFSGSSPDWDAIRNIIWDAVHVSDEFIMEIQWNNVYYYMHIYGGELRRTAKFTSHVAYQSFVSQRSAKELLDYKLQYVPGFTPPEFTGFVYTICADGFSMRIKLPDGLNMYKTGKKEGFTDIVDDKELPVVEGEKVFLYGMDESEANGIMVFTMDATKTDGKPYDDEGFYSDFSPYAGLFRSMGVQARELYTTNQAKFFRAHSNMRKDGKTAHNLFYLTICGGRAVCIYYESYDGEILPAEESLMEGVVDSIAFGNTIEAEEDGVPSGTVYKDAITKATFMMPAGWLEDESSILDGQLMASLVSDKSAEFITYVGLDGWAMTPDERKAGDTRADYNNSHWSKSEIGAMRGVPEEKVSMVMYNGAEYFKLVVDRPDLLPEGYTGTCMIMLYRMENGYMHLFAFPGDETSPCYPDFVALMNSVEYADE